MWTPCSMLPTPCAVEAADVKHGASARARAGTAHQRRRSKLLAAPAHQSRRAAAAITTAGASAFTCHGSAISAASGTKLASHETRDTGFLLAGLDQLWVRVPRYKPPSVGIVLLDLVPPGRHQLDLFEHHRRQKLSPVIDDINDRYNCGVAVRKSRTRPATAAGCSTCGA